MWQLGVDHPNLFIPFQTEGCTIYFDTFAPSDNKINCCPLIVLTDSELQWDPSGVDMHCNRPYRDNTYARIKSVTRENIS